MSEQAQTQQQTTPESPVQQEKPLMAPSVRDRAQPAGEGAGLRLTEKAADQIKEILRKDSYPQTMYLFVGVKGGGCSGLQYILDLRDEAHAPVGDSDEVFLSQDLVVVCDLKSYVVGNLNGTEIDYQETLMGAGFTFNNPNAKHTCGCGSSYSA
jgi:iron-sulfur cluster assembly protein